MISSTLGGKKELICDRKISLLTLTAPLSPITKKKKSKLQSCKKFNKSDYLYVIT